MASSTLNIFLTSFPGLNLPKTLCLPVSKTTSINEVTELIGQRLPHGLIHKLVLTTAFNKQIQQSSTKQISSLLSDASQQTSLSLRLSARLCGGKGGFGSQLRAAGGRMSSRKKRSQGDNNGSSRNLDGRRLRTVAEAKALAEYLAVKPEMDRKEKEERKKRWEQVVQAAEARADEIKSGTGKAKQDGKWLEDKEEAEAKMREAVLSSMKRNKFNQEDREDMDDDSNDESSSETSSAEEDEDHDQSSSTSKATTPPSTSGSRNSPLKVFGWDDEEGDDDGEDTSDEEAE